MRAGPHQMKRPYRSYVSMSGLNSYATGTMSQSNALLIGNVSTGKMTNNIMRVGLTWSFNTAAKQTANDYLTKK